jgi:hypothetical protein
VASSEAEGVLRGQDLGQACHHEQGDDGWEFVLADAEPTQRGGHDLELRGPEPRGGTRGLGADRL